MHVGYWYDNQTERSLGIPERRWMDNIKMDLRELG
jgi:hypothetical protein